MNQCKLINKQHSDLQKATEVGDTNFLWEQRPLFLQNKSEMMKTHVFIPRQFLKDFSFPSDLTDCNPPISVMAQMPPLIITPSLYSQNAFVFLFLWKSTFEVTINAS